MCGNGSASVLAALLQYNITDADEGDNAAILSYKIVGSNTIKSLFAVDHDGNLIALRPFDHETETQEYEFDIVVYDKGVKPQQQSSSTSVLVVVDNVLDETIRFLRPFWEAW